MNFAEQREHYRRNHRSLGCRLTHMIGVPLILASLPAYLIAGFLAAFVCFVAGWIFQLAGHALFENNKPVFLSTPGNLFTFPYAVIFVAEEWWRLLSGRGLKGL